MLATIGTPSEDGSCAGTTADELPIPKQCECQNGGICQLNGYCDCGDFEGEHCQKGSTVSRQLIGRFGSNALLAALLFVSLLACVVLMALVGTNLYRKRLLLFKKMKLLIALFHFTAISSHSAIQCSIPNHDTTPIEYGMVQLQGSVVTSSTTFSNPVYEMEESSDAQSSPVVASLTETSDSTTTSRAHSFVSVDMKPEPSSSVIAPHSNLRPNVPSPPRRKLKERNDKTMLVSNDEVTDV
ncbi:Low-density lipoprotein receptor-related protein [Dirofilaria immitis]|nr:Low-density lipoprotein receptor-related protein [Dirofilaria immitis]